MRHPGLIRLKGKAHTPLIIYSQLLQLLGTLLRITFVENIPFEQIEQNFKAHLTCLRIESIKITMSGTRTAPLQNFFHLLKWISYTIWAKN
jgi:hypothetical protein